MKYTVIYNSKYRNDESSNNKASAIKWANERLSPAIVIETATGTIIHRNASARKRLSNKRMLPDIAEAIKAGTPIGKIIKL